MADFPKDLIPRSCVSELNNRELTRVGMGKDFFYTYGKNCKRIISISKDFIHKL